jgi:Pyruvate/2-oxoacid:ferredoxin oxidoreductase gamma subunit
MLKGLLETEVAVALVTGPGGAPFGSLFRAAADEAALDLLRKHDMRALAVPTGARAVTLAHYAARSNRAAVALVPNDQLSLSAAALGRAASEGIPRGGALVIVLEDRPAHPRCPVRLMRQLGIAAIAPADVAELRDSMDTALRVSRAAGVAVAVCVHSDILHTTATIEAAPNRVIESVDAMLARRRRRRRPRVAEAGDVLRVMRRLEFNRVTSLPSPGERMPVGFVAVGPAHAALAHLVHTLRLAGRVPTLTLGAVHPIDDAAVQRLLSRCERVVVLEPRPGTVEARIIEVAESMRHRGERPALVWGRRLPDAEQGLGPNDAVHPSLLARRIVDLLHLVRPSGRVASQLVPEPARGTIEMPPRSSAVGVEAALAAVRRVAVEVDQWLRDHRGEVELAAAPQAISIDGRDPGAADRTARIAMLETWDPQRFQREGIAAIAQAARDDRPWIFVVCDVGGDDGQDLVRLARGVVPADRADRVSIEVAPLDDPPRLREVLRAAVISGRMTIVVARDGPVPRYDVLAIERMLAEVDRLGFEPRQRVGWSIERACAVRAPGGEAEAGAEPAAREPRATLVVDRLPSRLGRAVRFSVRTLTETVHVVRTRPPTQRFRFTDAGGGAGPSGGGPRLQLPEVVHRLAPHWRAHVAGMRGEAPGVVARVLLEAGRIMGYAVAAIHDPAPIAPGRSAWAEVLFTRPREGETAPAWSVRVPFGEADLLLGLDAAETLRAIETDPALRVAWAPRTFAVVNDGPFGDERRAESAAIVERLREAVRDAARQEGRQVGDFAGACRAWFHTDRLTDVAMLGAAFQAGLVPLTVDAIDGALAQVETAGFGRLREAFRFGRRLCVDRRLFTRPRDEEGDLVRVVDRLVRVGNRRRWRGHLITARFRALLASSSAAMPGLAETDAGRQAQRDFMSGLYRCLEWGGFDYAERYARSVTELYQADRGDTGRALTRAAILPLAESMLLRDAIYVAAMATSAEHQRRTRRALNAKPAREDRIERRFATRFELIALRWRVRADVVTSDWVARILAPARHVIPLRLRGSRRERALREAVIDLAAIAARDAALDYERFLAVFRLLHERAAEGTLHDLTAGELGLLTGRSATPAAVDHG